MFINKVIIYGNITRDPELKSLPSGLSVCNFSVATNRVWYDQSKKKQEEVEFHNIVCFGKIAENVGRFMKKGNGIFIEGRLKTRSWEKNGVKHYKVEIIAESVQFGPNRLPHNALKQEESDEDASLEKGLPVIEIEEEINPEDLPF